MRILALVGLCACGRIGFDSGDTTGDGSGLPAALWPNRPSDCTVHTDTTLETVPPANWALNTTITTVADSTAPSGAPAVAQFHYPIGFVGGLAPGDLHFYMVPPTARELYTGVYWKPSAGWEGHQSGFSSLMYIRQDDGGAVQTLQALTLRNPDAPFKLGTFYQGTPYDDVFSNYTVRLGEWQLVELYRKASTTATSADGVFEVYANGDLILRYSDVNFLQVPIVWVSINPIWGGTGDMKTSEDYFWYDRVIVCTR